MRLAGPCDRVIVSWSIDDSRLQTLIGDRFKLQAAIGGTELQLRILRCAAKRRGDSPLRFAYLAVPISGDSVPVVITGIPDDGWWAMPLLMADARSVETFAAMGYEVIAAEIDFAVVETHDGGSVNARLGTPFGSLEVSMPTTGSSVEVASSIALLTDDVTSISAFFGKETAARYSLDTYVIVEQSITVLGNLPLPGVPHTVSLDRSLQPDRIYWRLPIRPD